MKTSSILFSLAVLIATSGMAHDYAIKMDLPLKVGQRYQLTAVASDASANLAASEGKVLKSEKSELSVEMESEVTVLVVDAKGRPTKESYTIVKLLKGTAKEPLLAAGTKVIATRPGQKTVYEIDGKPAADDVAKALGLVVNVTSGGPTDDEIFGTTERKKVGDRWPVNQALALKDASENLGALGMSVTSVSGTTTLQKVTKDGGVDVLHLVGNMTAKLSPAAKGPFAAVDATMTATLTGAIPTEVTKGVRVEGSTMTATFKASSKPNAEGRMVQVSGNSKQSATRQYKLLD